MNISCLMNCNVKSPSLYNKNLGSQKQAIQISQKNTGLSSNNILALYNQAAINFGKRFDIKNLEDKKTNDVFLPDELKSESGGINIQSAIDLAYSYIKAEVSYLEKHGKLIPYKQREYLSECEYRGLSEEETRKFIEQKTIEFKEKISRLKQDVIEEIDKLTPTVK